MALHLFRTGDFGALGNEIGHFLPGWKIRGPGLVLLDPLVGSLPDTASWHLVAHWIHGIGRFAYVYIGDSFNAKCR